MSIHLFHRVQLALLIVNQALIAVFFEYSDYIDVFSPDFATKLLKRIEINNNSIDLIKSQQLPYGSIYSLKLVELETLKTYIKTNLANVLSDLPNLLLELLYFLSENQTVSSNYVLITEVLTNLTIKN